MEALLQEILDELRSSKTQLGFGPAPKVRYIYANRQHGDCLWYFWEKKTHEPILESSILAMVEALEIEAKEFKSKSCDKISLHIKADRSYVLQTGIDTLFGKGLLYSLSMIDNFAIPVRIAVEPGETEQVLFCRVYQNEQNIFAKIPDNVNWNAVIESIQAKLGGETPSPQPPEPIAVNHLSGQTELIPNESGGIVDRISIAIRQMGAQEIDHVSGMLSSWRSNLGESAHDILYKRLQERIKQLSKSSVNRAELTVSIGVEMRLLNWSVEDGKQYLMDNYGKKSRGELTDEELVGFLSVLKTLRSSVAVESEDVDF